MRANHKYAKPNPQLVLENNLKDLREKKLSEPTIQRQVGDVVSFGGVKHTVITEILDGGKIYKTHQVCTENNYGNPYDYERDMYVAWSECFTLYTLEDLKTMKPIAQPIDRLNFFNTDLYSLTFKYYNGVNMSPDYQRGNVWEEKDKIALVDSIFKGIDIGKFTFVVLSYEEYKESGFQWEILDGKQRLQTIIDFYEGRFQYCNKLFRDLHPRDRSQFESYLVLVAELPEGTTNKTKYETFLKVNTFGKPQDPSHIDHVKTLLWCEKT